MLTALCLVPGLLLAQPDLPPAPIPVDAPFKASLAAPLLADDKKPDDKKAEDKKDDEAPKNTDVKVDSAAAKSSVFSRPFFFDRASLSWVLGAGAGRFNMIDWESRPNGDRLWWLSRWPAEEEVQLYCQLGFNIHWWAGPVRRGTAPAPDLPPHLFDLYLDLAWTQRWTDRLTSEVRFRPGLYTDFGTTPPDAFRAPGQAFAVWRAWDELAFVGGVDCVERINVKVLPLAGVLWQPVDWWEMRLVFPEPKIAVELSAKHHVWGYVGGEYGGGRWTFKNGADHSERVEYSDFRLVFGLEWREDYFKNLPLLSEKSAAFLEMGYVFERRLRFTGLKDGYDPSPAWLLRFGWVW